MGKQITITSKEVSSLAAMDSLFENYCTRNKVVLDFSKGEICNGYLNEYTDKAFCWFMHGVFRAIGNDHLKDNESTTGG